MLRQLRNLSGEWAEEKFRSKETKFKFHLCHRGNLGKFPNLSASIFSHLRMVIIITTILSYFKNEMKKNMQMTQHTIDTQ